MARDWLLPLYDPIVKLLRIESHHRELIGRASPDAGDRLLEIGCGTGNLVLLTKRLHPDVEVTAIDPDGKALARAGRKARRRRLPVSLDRAFAQSLPYEDARFDQVMSAFMLHHLDPDDKEPALREAWRVLRPGGTLHVVDFSSSGVRSGGWMARLQSHSQRLRDNASARLVSHMKAAGFTDAAEVGSRNTVVGPVSHYRASRSAGTGRRARQGER